MYMIETPRVLHFSAFIIHVSINYNTRDEVRVLTTWSTMQARSSKVRVPM